MVTPDGGMPAQHPSPLDLSTLAQLRELEQRSGQPLVADLLISYMASAAEAMGQLSSAVEAGDLEAVTGVAHRLAGSSGAVGAVLMTEAFTAIRCAARSGDLAAVEAALADAVAAMALTRPALEAERTAND